MHHLIDPRTGLPARTDLAEASVVTDCALRGEVYAKCAVLLGLAAGEAFLRARGVHYALLRADLAGSSAA
jgi:thiamine biosynthesis lipoprotein